MSEHEFTSDGKLIPDLNLVATKKRIPAKERGSKKFEPIVVKIIEGDDDNERVYCFPWRLAVTCEGVHVCSGTDMTDPANEELTELTQTGRQVAQVLAWVLGVTGMEVFDFDIVVEIGRAFDWVDVDDTFFFGLETVLGLTENEIVPKYLDEYSEESEDDTDPSGSPDDSRDVPESKSTTKRVHPKDPFKLPNDSKDKTEEPPASDIPPEAGTPA